MTSTSTDFKPTVEDFDQWTEENDEEAFASIAQNYKVRHIIKGDVYWALVPGGRTYKLPLSMSIDDFTRLSNTSDDTESVEQLKRILSAFAGDKQAKALNGEPVQVVFNLLSDYGDAVVRSQGSLTGKIQWFSRQLADHGSVIRADFTTHGWSLQADLGGRLRYGDAIALLEQLIGDPSTYTGAELNGLDYPARWGEIPVVYALGSDEYPKPFDSLAKRLRADREKAERERLREQTKGMSPVFQTLYED